MAANLNSSCIKKISPQNDQLKIEIGDTELTIRICSQSASKVSLQLVGPRTAIYAVVPRDRPVKITDPK